MRRPQPHWAGACLLALALGSAPARALVAGVRVPLPRAGRGGALGLCMAARKSGLAKALHKPTGALTVSIEYGLQGENESTNKDLQDLSAQLRKAKAAALWTASLPDLAVLSTEQKRGKGDFPGPCPVVYFPEDSTADAEQIGAAAAAGASAVVLRSSLLDLGTAASDASVEVIWDVRSAEDIAAVSNAGLSAPILLLPGAAALEADLLSAVPKDAVGVASVQRDKDEIVLGRDLAKAGVKALVVCEACVGSRDDDASYARFVIDGLTSKASSNPKFQITGLGVNSGDADTRKSVGQVPTSGNQQNSVYWKT